LDSGQIVVRELETRGGSGRYLDSSGPFTRPGWKVTRRSTRGRVANWRATSRSKLTKMILRPLLDGKLVTTEKKGRNAVVHLTPSGEYMASPLTVPIAGTDR